jgi:DNA-directed RNA polymerase specialized sigma24 family protein
LTTLDPSLRAFASAADEEEAQRLLSALVVETAAPLVRRILARKLRTYARGGGGGDAFSTPPDLEDVTADALLALVGRLGALREDPGSVSIESFVDYTAVVAHNAFTHYLRRRHPARSRLKNRLRYVLGREKRFALWAGPEGLLCGLAGWQGRAPHPDGAGNLAAFAESGAAARWKNGHAWDDDPGAVLDAVLKAAGGPVDFDRVVAAVASFAPDTDAAPVSLDAPGVPPPADETLPADVLLDQKREAARLWREICELPVRQRAALLLNLRDPRGAGLLWVFPVTGVATIRDIARVLEMADADLAALWKGLPLDDHGIAERLSCTRQQVINLRSAARKRLARRLGDAAVPGGGPQKGNTTVISSSLVDER